VLVHNLDVFRACLRPAKTDAPLVIDADAVLPFPVTVQRFEMVSR
jgi:hypothetical protein